MRTKHLAASLLLVAVACGDDNSNARRDSVTPTPVTRPVVDTPRAIAPGDSTCPRDGVWRPCALVDRVVRSGLALRVVDSIEVPTLPAQGVRYRIGRGDTLTAFYFRDSLEAQRAARSIDTLTMKVNGDSTTRWALPATLMQAQNLVAILQSADAQQVERIRLAITAGAPFTAPALR